MLERKQPLMKSPSVIDITKHLVRMNTINPPGQEDQAMRYLAELLDGAGFKTEIIGTGPQRSCLVASLTGHDDAIALTGHLDTVPLGAEDWSVDPFAGEIRDGKLYGRGTTDMKGGVAAIVVAAINAKAAGTKRAMSLIFTSGEETGCEGARHLAESGQLKKASALLVAEPTSNKVCIGHKGAFWVRLKYTGRTAHGSMPELGDNAVLKAAAALPALRDLDLGSEAHAYLGRPSLNIGTFHGGLNVNSVPDRAIIEVDMRTLPGQRHDLILQQIHTVSGAAEIEVINDLPGVWTPPNAAFVAQVNDVATRAGVRSEPAAAPYFTDASILTAALGNPPTVIIGPGEMAMAHKTDEYCEVAKLHQAVEIYTGCLMAR
jgi:succinyl-diaminopimelate desuccinylase